MSTTSVFDWNVAGSQVTTLLYMIRDARVTGCSALPGLLL